MNRGLTIRALREMWPVTLLLSAVLLGVEAAMAYVLPKFSAQFTQEWLHVEFARGLIQAMLGTEIADSIRPEMFHALAWVHPVVLALVWAHALVCCTRVPAGEVDRGTADVLLGLPVSRRDVFLSETFVWLVSGVALLAAGLAGVVLGGLPLAPAQRPDLARVFIVMINFLCLYGAVGGLAWLVSAFSDRRGKAMTAIFLILLVLFLLHYLAQFWKPMAQFSFLSPLHYHRPVEVLISGVWPWRDMAVLTGMGGLTWLAAGIVFARRDLCTV